MLIVNPTDSLQINFQDYGYRFSIEKELSTGMNELNRSQKKHKWTKSLLIESNK